MPKLFSSGQLIRNITLSIFIGLMSSVLFAQTPAAPADPAAAAAGAAKPADPAAATDPAATPAAAATPPEKPIYASTIERDNALLAVAKPNEVLSLETANEKIISLYKITETRVAKGTLLILHASESPQLWPAPLENLRRNVPLYGWGSMAVPLPQKYLAKTPERDSGNASNNSAGSQAASDASASSVASSSASSVAANSSATSATSTANTSEPSASAQNDAPKILFPREQLITERTEAAIKILNDKGQFNIVLLVDNSTAPDSLAGIYTKINASTSTAKTIDGPIQALILINLQDQEPLSVEQLSSIFSIEFLPIIDVFFEPDDKFQMEVRRLHHAEAMRKNVKDYQQFVLPREHSVTVDDQQGFWLQKIRGFMERKAEGKITKKPAKEVM